MIAEGRRRAILLLGLGTLSFGSSAIFAKLCGFPPELIASFRLLVGGLLLLPLTLRTLPGILRVRSPAGRVRLLVPGLLLGLHFQLWVAGIRLTTAAAGTFLFAVNPVLFALAERLMFRRRIGTVTVVCLLLLLGGGAWLFAVGGTRLGSPGDLYCFLSTLFFVAYLLASERVSAGVPHLGYLAIIYTAGGLLTLPIGLATGAFARANWAEGASYLWLLCMVLLPTLLGHGSAAYAVRHLRPLTVSFFTLLEPVLATTYALLFINEVPPLRELPSYALLMLSTALYLAARRARSARGREKRTGLGSLREPGSPRHSGAS